jgi:5'(3')-deoxyribonucleotidase
VGFTRALMNEDRAPARTIAVDLDDTLNDFATTLQVIGVPHDPSYGFSETTFEDYLSRIRSNVADSSGLLSTEFSYFKYRVHSLCYRAAKANPEGVAFMRWLRERRWTIVICTGRDLRRAGDATRAWLTENDVPFDHLFMASNKIVFCKAWGIEHLVDDDPFNIVHGARYGIDVCYPIMPKHAALPEHGARGFRSFEEVKAWIER